MAEENDGPKDLFGEPWTPPRDPRGRKRHKRTAEVAEIVGNLRADGQTVVQIALYLGLSEPTLRKYYFRELEVGADLVDAEVMLALASKAKAGNVSAARLYFERRERGKAAVPVKRAAATTEKLGKKAQQNQDAKTAHEGTSWGDLLPN